VSKYTDIEVVETFLKRAQELRERAFLQSWAGPSLNIKYDHELGLAATSAPHDEEQFRSFLLALRHFLLNGEPTHINLVFNVAERTLTDEDLKQKLRDARDRWREAQRSSIVTFKLGDRILTPDQVTDAWINGYYFHNDADARILEKIAPQALAQPLARFTLENHVLTASQVVLYTANVLNHAKDNGLLRYDI
jgi:hypothetical protein